VSYTNSEFVKRHLIERYPTQSSVMNQSVVLAGVSDVVFYGGPIDSTSLSVKSVRNRLPSRTLVTLQGESTVIEANPMVPGTITVASDSSFGTVYTENEDFVIDAAAAILRVKSNGRLQIGSTVAVWYLVFTLYESGVDYSANTDKGSIRRLAGGDIADGEQVYLDYQPLYDSLGTDLLEAAVTEANGLVERAVDPDKQFGADPVLQTAATCRALEIVCRTAVTRDLSGGSSNDRTASVWMKLADYYAARSDELIRAFRPPVTNISKPTLS